jgi:hypothetical protein
MIIQILTKKSINKYKNSSSEIEYFVLGPSHTTIPYTMYQIDVRLTFKIL